MDVLGNLDTLQKTLAALAVIAGVFLGFLRWVRPKLQRVGSEARAGLDALVGREEIRDSITGKVLVPALPGIGVRMDTNEHELREQRAALTTLAEAVGKIADNQGQLTDHERRLKVLEEAHVERVVTKVESAQAWRAMEAVARSTPDDEALPGIGEN